MISMYAHQCCSRSTLDIAGTLLALSYIFCVEDASPSLRYLPGPEAYIIMYKYLYI